MFSVGFIHQTVFIFIPTSEMSFFYPMNVTIFSFCTFNFIKIYLLCSTHAQLTNCTIYTIFNLFVDTTFCAQSPFSHGARCIKFNPYQYHKNWEKSHQHPNCIHNNSHFLCVKQTFTQQVSTAFASFDAWKTTFLIALHFIMMMAGGKNLPQIFCTKIVLI